MKEQEEIVADIYKQIVERRANKAAAKEQMIAMRPQGKTLFRRAETLLKGSGHLDELIIFPGGSPRGNRRYTIIELSPVNISVVNGDESGQLQLTLSIHPERLFDDSLKPAITVELVENVAEDESAPHLIELFAISQDGDMLNWKNDYCDKNDIQNAQVLISYLEGKCPTQNSLPLDIPWLTG